MTVKYTFKINIPLVIRMYFDHNYSREDICLRLRYSSEAVEAVIKSHEFKNGKSGDNQSSACTT